MKLTGGHGVGDVLFLQTLSKHATLFGVVPNYDYRKRKLTHRKLYRCYVLIVVCVVISCSAVSLYHRFMFEPIRINAKIMDIMVEVVGLVLFVTLTFGSSFWNMQTWDKLIHQLSRIEGPANLNTRRTMRGTLMENPIVVFTAGSLFYISLALCSLYYMGISMFRYHISQIMLHYIKYVLLNVMYNVTLSIKRKYEDLKDMLNCLNDLKKERVKLLRKVRMLNLELDGVVETFNLFFGWPVLLLLTHSFVQILCSLSLLTMKNFATVRFNFLICIYMFGNLVIILISISTCDNAMKASREVFKICCELRVAFPVQSREAEEMEKLLTMLRRQYKITAAGFFEIDRSLLLSVFSTMTTYMIVVIQFNSIIQ